MSAQPMRPVLPGRSGAPAQARPRVAGANALAPERAVRPAARSAPRPAARPVAATGTGRAPHLRAVSAPRASRSLTPFATLCIAIILASLASVLLLNTAMARGSYDAVSMRREIAQYQQERVALLTQLELASAPAGLASAARELGMVRADRIGFVSLADGVVMESSAG